MDRTQRELEWFEGFFLKAFSEGIESFLYPESIPFEVTATVDREPIPFAALGERAFHPVAEGERWGENWDSAWFRLTGTVPEAWEGREVVARLHFGGEACVFDEAGEPVQGLTGASVHLDPFVRDLFRLESECRGGRRVALWVEAAASELWGVPTGHVPLAPAAQQAPGTSAPVGVIRHARLARFEEAMAQLYFDATVLYRLMMDLSRDDPWRARIRSGLHEARRAFRPQAPDAAAARARLAPLLACRASGAEPETIAVGHAHLDTAWLWPMRESIRKCGRSFSTQIGLMERYPDYVFGASQAPHYLFVQEHYPGLYRKIEQAVAEGRWEVLGAMWVESDCNLPRGESLARQLLYGKRFSREAFGVDVRHAWLPDVFGYPASLPQLFRQAGVDYFVTQKLSWNTVNRFPHHTFHWRGIDGTTILSHLLPMESYNGQLFPDTNRFAARNHAEKGFLPEFLTCFGIGDGGGGPSDKHIEFGRRQRDLAGCPRLTFGSAASQLDRLAAHAGALATWDGPLYLERHQGTLTTHARMKRRNRELENRLRELELRFAAGPAEAYPRQALRACWQRLLTNQFHDILPGSSITCVYEDAHRDYDRIESRLDALEEDLAAEPGAPSLVFNPHAEPFTGVIPDGEGGWAHVSVPGLATRPREAAARDLAPGEAVSADMERLENGRVCYRFDAGGRLVSAYEKTRRRELLAPGTPAHRLLLFEDTLGDAWDADVDTRAQLVEEARLVARRVVSDSDRVGALAFTFELGASTLTQEVRLRAGSRRLDFVTDITWRERGRELRVRFPVDLRARTGTTEIQFGLQRWPLHENTSWERALADVPGYRFADISEPDVGAALLNDCKYGYRLEPGCLELNLLRSSRYPDPEADAGAHRVTYAFLPHPGPLEASDVFAEAAWLNEPVRMAAIRPVALPLALEAEGVRVESVKRAEDEPAALVLRGYESRGCREAVRVQVPEGMSLHEATLLESAGDALPVSGGVCRLTFRPFEIKTLILQPEKASTSDDG